MLFLNRSTIFTDYPTRHNKNKGRTDYDVQDIQSTTVLSVKIERVSKRLGYTKMPIDP